MMSINQTQDEKKEYIKLLTQGICNVKCINEYVGYYLTFYFIFEINIFFIFFFFFFELLLKILFGYFKSFSFDEYLSYIFGSYRS